MFSHIKGKLSSRPFKLYGSEHRTISKNNQCTFYSFILQYRSVQLHQMESSRRDLSYFMAEHKAILVNNQDTYYSLIFQYRPVFSHNNRELSPRPFILYG